LDDPGGSSFLLFIPVLLLLSALFSASETALFSLSTVRTRQLEEKGVKGAKIISRLLSNSPKTLSTILIGNTIVNTWCTNLVTTLFLILMEVRWGARAAGAVASVATTILLLVFGEVTPKSIAAAIPERIALLVSRPIQFFSWLLAPLVRLFDILTVSSKTGLDEPTATSGVTEEIIKTAVNISHEEGELEEKTRAMIYGIFASDDTPVEQLMTPRERIVALPLEASVDEAIQTMVSAGLSRLPVYRGDLDHIVGMIYAKDLVIALCQNQRVNIRDLIRPVMRCRPQRKMNHLLQEMRARRAQLCIVVNEHNQPLGLVTMEDLLEAIVGEISDEYDGSIAATRGLVSC
jgi:putative hemolysin